MCRGGGVEGGVEGGGVEGGVLITQRESNYIQTKTNLDSLFLSQL